MIFTGGSQYAEFTVFNIGNYTSVRVVYYPLKKLIWPEIGEDKRICGGCDVYVLNTLAVYGTAFICRYCYVGKLVKANVANVILIFVEALS